MRPAREPWDDWDEFVRDGLAREARTGLQRSVVRSRLVRGFIWFALAILPARERWIGWLLDGPHPVVQPFDGEVTDIRELVPSLPSSP